MKLQMVDQNILSNTIVQKLIDVIDEIGVDWIPIPLQGDILNLLAKFKAQSNPIQKVYIFASEKNKDAKMQCNDELTRFGFTVVSQQQQTDILTEIQLMNSANIVVVIAESDDEITPIIRATAQHECTIILIGSIDLSILDNKLVYTRYDCVTSFINNLIKLKEEHELLSSVLDNELIQKSIESEQYKLLDANSISFADYYNIIE